MQRDLQGGGNFVPWREVPQMVDGQMARTKPNILLITCDQWRGDCLSAVGHPVVQNAERDALAAEGVLFRGTMAGRRPARRRAPASIRASTR